MRIRENLGDNQSFNDTRFSAETFVSYARAHERTSTFNRRLKARTRAWNSQKFSAEKRVSLNDGLSHVLFSFLRSFSIVWWVVVGSVSQLKTLPHRIVHLYFQLFYIQIQTNLHRKFFDLTQNKYSIMIFRFAKFELKRPYWSHSTVRFSADKLTLLTKTKTIINRR